MSGLEIQAARTASNHEVLGSLWEIQASLLGLSELLKNQSPEALFSMDGAHGIGTILESLSCKISRVADSIGLRQEA